MASQRQGFPSAEWRRLKTHPFAILEFTGKNEAEKCLKKKLEGLVYLGEWLKLEVLSCGPRILGGRFGLLKSRGTAARTKKGGEVAIVVIAIDTFDM